MYIEKLKVIDFRNYAEAEVNLSPKVNALIGANAQGKTNLVEAIYVCAVGKSFRTPRDRELIRGGCKCARASVVTNKEAGIDTVEVAISSAKKFSVNKIPVTRLGELMGVCAAVLFSPDELKIVKESPSDRRRFLNISLCQMSKAYYYTLARYNRALVNRNKILKSGAFDEADIAVWDEILATEGSKIIKSRRGYLAALTPHVQQVHKFLTSGKEEITLSYEGLDGADTNEIKNAFLQSLKSDRERDNRLRYTHTGAHKDDIAISVNGLDLRTYGSQGQQRTAALSLKLAETRLMTEKLDTAPVLLLDDVLSELDLDRRTQLFECISGLQVIITATELEPNPDINIIRVQNGSILN